MSDTNNTLNKTALRTYVNFLQKYVSEYNIKLNESGNFNDIFPFGNYGRCANLLLGKQSDIDFMQNHINVTTEIDTFTKYYDYQGCLVLREYNNETILIIGCGSVINYQDIKNRYSGSSKTDEHYCDFNEKHKHVGHYTIDPDITLNPSIVGFFGYQKFTNIPDGSFTKIIFEGFYPDDEESEGPYFDSELKRLLREGYSDCVYCTSSDKEVKKLLKQ
jgi:hypothetical protein